MIRRFLFLAALAASAPSWSAVTLSNFPPNPGVLPGGGWQFTSGTTFANPTPARAWVNGVYGGVPSATASDALTLSGRAGALAVTARTTVSAAEVAIALARVAGRANAAIAIGSLAYDLLAGAGVRNTPAGAEVDPGTLPNNTTETQYRASFSSYVGPFVSSRAGALAALVGAMPKTQDMGGCTASLTYSVPDSVTLAFTETNAGCVNSLGYLIGKGTYSRIASIYQESRPVTGCSPIVDSLTGQTYVPGVRADGKCMTGRYSAATSEAQVALALKPVVESSVSGAAKAAISAGGEIQSSGFSVTGPASQTGTPTSTTTTGPAGTTTTTITPTYSYTYSGDTITINTTNTTSTTNITNEGDTTTTTETTTTPGNDDKGMCSLYPDSLACMKPGTPSDAEQIPIDRRPVTITKDPRWAANAGACTRGAIQLTSGVSINLWQPFCDFFALIRGVVVGMFGLAGAFIFRNGVK